MVIVYVKLMLREREREKNKSQKKLWGPAGNQTQDLQNAI